LLRPLPGGPTRLARPVFDTKKIEEAYQATKAKPAYSLSVSYPGCAAGLAQAQHAVAAFHKDFQELAENRGDGIDCSLTMNYSLVYSGPTLISVFFEGSSFLGGAHRSVLQRALLLTPHGGSVDLASAFARGAAGLKPSATIAARNSANASWTVTANGSTKAPTPPETTTKWCCLRPKGCA